MYALVIDDQIINVHNNLPSGARDLTTGDWVTPPNGQWTQAQAEACGYFEVTMVSRPPDAGTTTYDFGGYELIDGVPTQTWVSREKSPEEIQMELDIETARIEEEKKGAAVNATVAMIETAHEDGQPWVQPTGAHDSYKYGATCTHNGKNWVSLVFANVWEPGVSGWREETGGEPALWIQPTGSHDAYPLGAQVSHNDQIWESIVDNNVWEPGVYGWVLV